MLREASFHPARSLGTLALACTLLSTGCGEDRSPVASDDGPSFPRPPSPPVLEYVAVVSEGADVLELAHAHEFEVLEYDEAGEILRFATAGDPNAPEFEAVQLNGETILQGPISGVVYFVEGEPAYGDQAALDCMQLADCNAIATGEGVTVALLDTGIDYHHPWIGNNVVYFDHPILGDAAYNIGAVNGFHATAMAGLMVTVAPDVTIVPFQVIGDEGRGTDFELAVGLRAAVDYGVDLINLSLAATADSPVIEFLVAEATELGILIVAAAGNNTGDGSPTYPASGDAIAVAALVGGATCTSIDTYSAYGIKVEFAAVGTEVISAYPGARNAALTGTSNSAALTTGALAALLDFIEPTHPIAAVNRLAGTAYAVSGAGGATVVYGGIDLLAALTH